jgi:hypothetical protein
MTPLRPEATRGRARQTCPACGRVEAGGSYCTGCITPTGPDLWERSSKRGPMPKVPHKASAFVQEARSTASGAQDQPVEARPACRNAGPPRHDPRRVHASSAEADRRARHHLIAVTSVTGKPAP